MADAYENGAPMSGLPLPNGRPWIWHRLNEAVRLKFARSCSVEDGELAHVGGMGFSLRNGCVGNLIQGNHIFDIGANGVNVGEFEDNPTEIARNNRVSNNHIHGCGVLHFGGVGVWAGCTDGTVVSHNLIHDLPYSGISVGWIWGLPSVPTSCKNNRVEYNHVYDVMRILCDGGGIYTMGFQPGTVLRGNLVHHVLCSPVARRNDHFGIYLDEGSSGFLIEENTVYGTSNTPMWFNGVKDLNLRKNVIVGAKPYGYGTPCAQDITYEDNKVNPAPPPSMSLRDSNGRPGKAHFNAPERIGKDADQVGYWGFPVAEEEPDYVKLARAKAGLEASFRSALLGQE
ncbi:MAG: right-handed parallel beta-helix repeat-containing protein [Thermoguttaceae bacterium]